MRVDSLVDVAVSAVLSTSRRAPPVTMCWTSTQVTVHTYLPSPTSHWYARRLRARHNLAIVSSFAEGGDILELGSGGGHFLDEARNRGFSPHGIEPNPIQAQFIREELGIPCEQLPLREVSFGGRRFDVIYHCDVLSHFIDPLAEFAAMHRALKEGGVVVFETGNLADVGESYLSHIPSFQYPDHLYFFGMRSISQLLEQTGFELTRTYIYSILPQLAASRVFTACKTLLHRADSSSSCPAAIAVREESHSDRSREFVRRLGPKALIARGGQRAKHILRYRIGLVAPKHGRPQTVVAVARRRERTV